MDIRYMKRAVQLARKGIGWTNPNPLVGAVIVKDGEIIGEGYHERYGDLHAERNAFKHCRKDSKGASMYVTLEPCCHYGKTPPCAKAIIEHGIAKVYVGNLDPNPKVAGNGIKILRKHGIDVEEGILDHECRALNDVFFHYIQNDTPYVALKYAMTMDGKIATATGESKWITGEKAREHVHQLRHQYAGIMVGIGTVLADDPMLNVRLKHGNNPVRIICDSKLRIPEDSKIVQTAKEIPTIIAALSDEGEKAERLKKAGCQILHIPGKQGDISIEELLQWLHREKIDSVLVEGGGTLNETVIKSGLVNKVYAYIAPKVFGGKTAKTPVEGEGIQHISDALSFDSMEVQMIGNDILLEGKVKKCLPEL